MPTPVGTPSLAPHPAPPAASATVPAVAAADSSAIDAGASVTSVSTATVALTTSPPQRPTDGVGAASPLPSGRIASASAEGEDGEGVEGAEGEGGEGGAGEGAGEGGAEEVPGAGEEALVQDLMRVQGALRSLVEMLAHASEQLQVTVAPRLPHARACTHAPMPHKSPYDSSNATIRAHTHAARTHNAHRARRTHARARRACTQPIHLQTYARAPRSSR